jgi:hypothetical protein
MAVNAFAVDPGKPLPELPAGAEVDPELIHEQLISHAWQCRTCWHWRNQLWALHRLCPTGAGLADRYALAEVRKGRGE